jgi:hypothetical protein
MVPMKLSDPVGLLGRLVLLCLALCEPFAGISAAAGQSRDASGGGGDDLVLDLAIQLGVLTPAGSGREMAHVSDSRVLALDGGGPMLTLGLSARGGRARSAWRFGVSMLRAPTSEAKGRYDCRRDLDVPCSSVLIQRTVDFAVTVVTLDGEFAPARGGEGLSSAGVVGLGVRRSSVRWPDDSAEGRSSEVRTGPAAKAGWVMRWRWTDAAMSLTAEDHMGWMRDPGPGMTHDIVVSLALEWHPQ